MSCLVCTDRTFEEVCKFYAETPCCSDPLGGNFDEKAAAQWATRLKAANEAAFLCRYKNEPASPPEPCSFDPEMPCTLSLVEVLVALNCIDYQCCELPTWESSPEARLVQWIRNAAISALPGYRAACDTAWPVRSDRPRLQKLFA